MGVLPVLGTPSLRSSSNESSDVPGSVGASSDSFAIVDNVAFAIPLGAILSTLALLTFLGNAMVVHAIRTERKLHTVSNMFILSLAIADLTVGLVVMPLSSTYVLFGDWILGLFVCQLWLVIDYTASTASIFNLLILSLDRYWSIRSPLKYLAQRTKKRALAMIAIVWMISALWAIPIIGWHQWYNSGVRKHPNLVCETEFSDSVAFKITTSIANFIIPMSLMVILYYKIFREIKRRGNISDIGRSINRVSCAQHRGANKENSFTASLRHTFDGSFHTSSSSNASKARFKLKMSSNKAPTQLDSASVTLHHSQGDCATCIKPTVPRHTLLRRLLDPFIKNGTNQALSAETSPNLTSGIKSSTSTVARNGTVGGNGSVPTASTTFTTMTNELCHSASATALATAAQQILVSSPSPVKVTASEDLVPVESSRTQLTPLIREMRREQLSRDNGHRIMRMSVHCPKCTYSLVSQIVSDQSSGEHKSSISNHCEQNECVMKEKLSNDQCSLGEESLQSQSSTSSISSSPSVSLNSDDICPPTPSEIFDPSQTSISPPPYFPPNSSFRHFTASPKSNRTSPPSMNQIVPQSASSANIHRSNSLKSAYTKQQQQLKSSHDPIISTDRLNGIAYYHELTLMSLYSSITPYLNSPELGIKPSEPASLSQNVQNNSKIVQSKSSFDFSDTSTNNLLSVQGNHYSGVNVQVQYVDCNGTNNTKSNPFAKCQIFSKSVSNVTQHSPVAKERLNGCTKSRSFLPFGLIKKSSADAISTKMCSLTSECTANHHQSNRGSTNKTKDSSNVPLSGVNDSKQDGDQSRSCNADSDGTFQLVTSAIEATQSLIVGSSLTTNTATTVIASSMAGKKEKSKKENKSKKKKSSKKVKMSPSNTSPNSDEIRNESLRLSPVEQMDSCHSGKSQCSKCGCSLLKSISQASNISNAHVGESDEQKSIRSSASVHSVPKSRPNAMSLMSVPKHSGQLNSFTNLPMISASKPPLSKKLSSKSQSSFRESFRISTNSFKNFGRVRKNSFNQPANLFCADCASLASAVSAAARHRQELRREESSRLRQEKKAARQLGVILGAFILCWMPYIITYVVTASCTNCVSLTVHQVTIWLGYLNSFLNPFLYALCNENFKHAFKKMLGKMAPPQHLSYNYDQNTIGGTVGGGSINTNGTTTGTIPAVAPTRMTSTLRLDTK